MKPSKKRDAAAQAHHDAWVAGEIHAGELDDLDRLVIEPLPSLRSLGDTPLEQEVERLRDQLAVASDLLDDARCQLRDPALIASWARRRKKFRDDIASSFPG